jgi:hypothetical protein
MCHLLGDGFFTANHFELGVHMSKSSSPSPSNRICLDKLVSDVTASAVSTVRSQIDSMKATLDRLAAALDGLGPGPVASVGLQLTELASRVEGLLFGTELAASIAKADEESAAAPVLKTEEPT